MQAGARDSRKQVAGTGEAEREGRERKRERGVKCSLVVTVGRQENLDWGVQGKGGGGKETPLSADAV